MYDPNYDLRRSVLDDRHGSGADYLIATSRVCIAESQRHIEHSNELIAETQATIERSRTLLAASTRLAATASPQRPAPWEPRCSSADQRSDQKPNPGPGEQAPKGHQKQGGAP